MKYLLLLKKFFLPTVAAACLAGSMGAVAAGLSQIKVSSALGQPFSAEIDITGLPAEEFEFELAKGVLASPEAYEDAKLIYPPFLRQLRVSTERRADGKPFLRVASNAPINEPAFNLLVDFNWRGGRLLQKYSILLDPPK
ncbi:MAG: hypothetical protein ABI790_07845 [Betaproteobacteria bacterium]